MNAIVALLTLTLLLPLRLLGYAYVVGRHQWLTGLALAKHALGDVELFAEEPPKPFPPGMKKAMRVTP